MKINWSLLVSFAVHAAILLFGLVALPNPSEHKISEPPPIAVNIEDFQDVAKRANQTTEPVETERKPDEAPHANRRPSLKQSPSHQSPPKPNLTRSRLKS